MKMIRFAAVAALLIIGGAAGHADVFDAAKAGDVAALQKYLDAGGKTNLTNGDGLTLLHVAAANGEVDVAKLLIQHGAAVNAKDPNLGLTPLHVAAVSNQPEMTRFLLDHGADCNARSNDGLTPLALAVESDADSVVNILLDFRPPAPPAAARKPRHHRHFARHRR